MILDETAKGPVNRELLDTGIRCAMAIEDTVHAVELAHLSKGNVRYGETLAQRSGGVNRRVLPVQLLMRSS